MSPAALQFFGSLAAILVLAGIAWRLRLGNDTPIADEGHARRLADEVHAGFEPKSVAVSREGRSAILANDHGQVMVLRRHGAHFAGRILSPLASATSTAGKLRIDSGEKRFGAVELDINDPSAWVQAIANIDRTHNA